MLTSNHVATTDGHNIIDNGVGTIQVAANQGASHGHILHFQRSAMLHPVQPWCSAMHVIHRTDQANIIAETLKIRAEIVRQIDLEQC
jgi:hypothetical protein